MATNGNDKTGKKITVFISYSHDSEEHKERILSLSDQLITDGIDCELDQYYSRSPRGGWPKWMDNQITNSDFVLIICTKTYLQRVKGEEEKGKGKGVKWESTLTYNHLYHNDSINERFIPVLLNNDDAQFIPLPLKGETSYCISSKEGYEKLLRAILDQPDIIKPIPGNQKYLPPRVQKLLLFPEVQDSAGIISRINTDKKISHSRIIRRIIAAICLFLLFSIFWVITRTSPLNQPNPYYYNLKRDELLKATKETIKTIGAPWIVLSLKDKISVYKESNLDKDGLFFKARFLQKFEVLDKAGNRLKVKEVDYASSREGWVNMKDVLYLPIPLKYPQSGIYQLAFFPHDAQDIKDEKIKKFKFYKTSGETIDYNAEKEVSSIPFLYIYELERNYDEYALLGNYPEGDDGIPDIKIIANSIYGWSRNSHFFLWETRWGVIPSMGTNHLSYIFLYGDQLMNFYKQEITITPWSNPDTEYLVLKPENKWKENEWPLFLLKEMGEYNRLFCNLKSSYTGEIMKSRYYCQHLGYVKHIDPRTIVTKQFFYVYILRKGDIKAVISYLRKYLYYLQRQEYSAIEISRVIKEIDEMVFKNLPLLFKKTREKIFQYGADNKKELINTLSDVTDKLVYWIEGKAISGRFFGQMNDQYMWLYEDELF